MTIKDAKLLEKENVKIYLKSDKDNSNNRCLEEHGDIWFFNGVGFNNKFLEPERGK